MRTKILLLITLTIGAFITGCKEQVKTKISENTLDSVRTAPVKDTPEYFQLRPEVEKAYGYTHAVKIGHDIKISGAVSMDNEGNPTAVGDMEQQMKNCYSDIEKILASYGCTFDDVIKENIFTTDMPKFLEVAAYRNEVYTKQFPTGSWLGVKELALPEFLIEIELEVYKQHK